MDVLGFIRECPSSIGAPATGASAPGFCCNLEFVAGTPTAGGAGGVGKMPDLAGWFALGLCLTATDVVLESTVAALLTKW